MKPYQNRERMRRKHESIAAMYFALEEYQDKNILSPEIDEIETFLVDFIIALWGLCQEKELNFQSLVRRAMPIVIEETPPGHPV